MANSIIDDVIDEEDNSKENVKKKSSKMFVFLIILLILIIAISAVVFIYLKKKNEITPKIEFINYLTKNNFVSVFSFDSFDSLQAKLQNDSSESTTQISFTSPTLGIDDIEISMETKNNPKDEKTYVETGFNYGGNEILTTKFLSSNNSIAIKSDEIVVKYLGTKNENLGSVLSQIVGEDIPYIEMINELSEMELSNKVNVSENIFDKYLEIIKNGVEESSFNTKPITLERASGQIDVTEYTMTLNEEKALEILSQMLQTLENDDELLDLLVNSYNTFGLDKELFKSGIDNIINKMYEEPIDNNRTYSVKVYGNKDITYKMIIDIAGEYTLDFDYEYGEKQNSVLITLLETKSQDGFKINIIKNVTDVSEKITIVANLIKNADIVGELTITSNLLKSGNAYELKNKINLNMLFLSFDIEMNTSIKFNSVQIEDLDNSNCIFLDTLDADTFNDIIKAIEDKTTEVLEQKLKQVPILENASQNDKTIAQRMTGLEETETREEARQKVYDAVSLAMGKAQENGEEYTLSNIVDLEIPDSTVSVSVNDNIAVINIDGYEFTIDSDFNLSN